MKAIQRAMGAACLVWALAGAMPQGWAAPKESVATMGDNGATKIGIYDSRAVAVAFAGSEKQEASTKALRAERDQAKATGDEKRVAALEAEGKARQAKLHRQAFGAASVNDILALYPEEIQALKGKHILADLVSKWDEAGLANHSGAERVDVTNELIEIPRPNDRQRKSAQKIQKSKPLTNAQLDKAFRHEEQ